MSNIQTIVDKLTKNGFPLAIKDGDILYKDIPLGLTAIIKHINESDVEDIMFWDKMMNAADALDPFDKKIHEHVDDMASHFDIKSDETTRFKDELNKIQLNILLLKLKTMQKNVESVADLKMAKQISDLELQLKNALRSAKEAENNLQEVRMIAQKSGEEIESCNKKLADLREEISAKEKKCVEIKNELEMKTARLSILEDSSKQAKEIKSPGESHKREIENLNKEINKLRDDLAAVNMEREKDVVNRHKIAEQRTKRGTDLQKLRQEHADLQTKQGASEKQIIKLNAEIANLNERAKNNAGSGKDIFLALIKQLTAKLSLLSNYMALPQPQSGGSQSYKFKYLKYKTKYVNLKNNIY